MDNREKEKLSSMCPLFKRGEHDVSRKAMSKTRVPRSGVSARARDREVHGTDSSRGRAAKEPDQRERSNAPRCEERC